MIGLTLTSNSKLIHINPNYIIAVTPIPTGGSEVYVSGREEPFRVNDGVPNILKYIKEGKSPA